MKNKEVINCVETKAEKWLSPEDSNITLTHIEEIFVSKQERIITTLMKKRNHSVFEQSSSNQHNKKHYLFVVKFNANKVYT